MIEGYEQFVITSYLLRLLRYQQLSFKALADIARFLEENCSFIGLDMEDEDFFKLLDTFRDAVKEKTGARTLYEQARGAMENKLTLQAQELESNKPGHLETNIDLLGNELGLDQVERGFLGLLIRFNSYSNLQGLFNEFTQEHLGLIEMCAVCLGVDSLALNDSLRPNSRLLFSGIICQPGRNGNDLDDLFDIPEAVRVGLQKAQGTKEDLRHYILGNPATSSLAWGDFDHLGAAAEKLALFLQTSVENRVAGVNILLYGPPGTGKTEFCKTLASHLGLKLYALGEQNEDGLEPRHHDRVASLLLAQNLLRYQNQSLLLFDEMDDLFEGKSLAKIFGVKMAMGSKVFTNRLFESNPVPTIWTINDPQFLDETIVRRMVLAIELKTPSTRTRENLWQKVLRKNDLSFYQSDIHKLAQLDIPPAVVDNAARVAKQIGGKVEDFLFAAQGIVKVISGKNPQPKESGITPFSLELIQSNLDLNTVINGLQKNQRRDFSLCLYGPPGTGKSAFVRHLARTLDMPVLFKRASDLMDAYVGETEKSIAKAFQEALDKEAFLVFDEADSLLGDRRYAVRNWEVSHVNEMLTWMESHPFPFACTTNLMDRLDVASLRRFTFKCHFDYLSAEQVQRAFEVFFNLQCPGAIADGLKGLTPGDFALVGKKAELLGFQPDPRGFEQLLQKELIEKGYHQERQIGF